MQTRVISADSIENIRQAARLVRSGEVVAFPTETVYGLGADATNSVAVARVFALKERPSFDPLIVHIAGVDMLPGVVRAVPESAGRLIEAFWPGPLTLVLFKSEGIPDIVTAGLPTVAVRMPGNEVALALIREAGVPIAAPSANRFGRPSPTCAEHVMEDLGGKIALILDGGTTRIGVESTVLDLTCSPPVILRPGGVSKEALEKVLGEVLALPQEGNVEIRSPGQMRKHYAPRARVLLFDGECREKVMAAIKAKAEELRKGSRVGVMVPEEEACHLGSDVVVMNPGSFADLEGVASRLFEILRALDREGVDYILALAPPKRGIGLAIFDRLFKAAGSRVIEVGSSD